MRLLLILIVFTLISCDSKKSMINDSSMEPTLKRGSTVRWKSKSFTHERPKRGDIIVFRSPVDHNLVWAMRVVGMPGEIVEIEGDVILFNKKSHAFPLRDSMLKIIPPRYPKQDMVSHAFEQISFPYKIPMDSYFVVGDNQHSSLDSRYWGAIPLTELLGIVEK